MSNYPPGVTGNEPQISGEWPCYCDRDPDCPLCGGSGILREEVEELIEVKRRIADLFEKNDLGFIAFDTDDDYLAIHTHFRVVGDQTILETTDE